MGEGDVSFANVRLKDAVVVTTTTILLTSWTGAPEGARAENLGAGSSFRTVWIVVAGGFHGAMALEGNTRLDQRRDSVNGGLEGGSRAK